MHGDNLRVTVQDAGVGIPEDQVNEVFEKFHQLDCDPHQGKGGLGLGLSIVQRIADLLHTHV